MCSQIWATITVIRVIRNKARLPRLSVMSQCLAMTAGGHQGKNRSVLVALVHKEPVRVDMQLLVFRPASFPPMISVFALKQC